jgi:hypothetical protein
MPVFNEDNFHNEFAYQCDPVMANALARYGLDLPHLRRLGTEPVTSVRFGREETWRSWLDLLEMRNVGPKRVLHLVNFLRRNGIELPWFRTFDADTADWKTLRGCPRYTPIAPAGE